MEVVFNNPANIFQNYAKCEVANGENAELVMNIQAGSIQVDGQGIGEAGRDDIVDAFGEDAAFVTGVPAHSIQILNYLVHIKR